MVKMNNHSESEDFQISKLNEFFLVADRIRKTGRNATLCKVSTNSKVSQTLAATAPVSPFQQAAGKRLSPTDLLLWSLRL